MSNYNPLPLFYDKQCTQPIPSRVVGDTIFYSMVVGPVRTRQVNYSSFYVKNASLANVENISVAVQPATGETGVTVTLASEGKLEKLGVGEVYVGLLKIDVAEGVKASPDRYRVGIGLEAEITRE
jgi:hypothetical protein